MPARWVCFVILLSWVGSLSWMFSRDWLPWILADGDNPPFVFELADEVVTQNALWTLYRNGERLGTARSNLRFQRNNTFEWTNTISHFRYRVQLPPNFDFEIHFPKIVTAMNVTPNGKLIDFTSQAEMKFRLFGTEQDASLLLDGSVENETISGTLTLQFAGNKIETPYGPVTLKSRNVFTPLQPLFRISGIRPGRIWKLNQFDPVNEAGRAALQNLLEEQLKKSKLPDAFNFTIPSTTGIQLVAQVIDKTESIKHVDRMRECYIIEYRDSELRARTWVAVDDGTVIRQEAMSNGESLILQRE